MMVKSLSIVHFVMPCFQENSMGKIILHILDLSYVTFVITTFFLLVLIGMLNQFMTERSHSNVTLGITVAVI